MLVNFLALGSYHAAIITPVHNEILLLILLMHKAYNYSINSLKCYDSITMKMLLMTKCSVILAIKYLMGWINS